MGKWQGAFARMNCEENAKTNQWHERVAIDIAD